MKAFNPRRLATRLSDLVAPAEDHRSQASRIDFMEENVFLPVKLFVVFLLFNFIYFSGTFTKPAFELGDRLIKEPTALVEDDELFERAEQHFSIDTVTRVFWVYVAFNLVTAYFLIFMHRFNIVFIQWLVLVNNIVDAMFLNSWSMETGLLTDTLYWIFLGLIIRNGVSIPVVTLQLAANFSVIGCFVYSGYYNRMIIAEGIRRLDEDTVNVEMLAVRICLMLLLAACCLGVQVLFDHRRRANEDLEEFAARQQQLETAGRLAAEVAHQIKNPLAIITNSLFILERHLRKKPDPPPPQPNRQIEIIREEVERADRIITELMGYAQLAEGRVENLILAEEIRLAIEQVFPTGSNFETVVDCEIAENLPPLKMQRGHLNEILVNILKNCRDIQNGDPRIEIRARPAPDDHIVITIDDNGPGIPDDTVERVFEPYYTTKSAGSGLGLSIVKHNTEIYGGHVRVAPGNLKGARFEIELPTRTLMRFRN